jgi:hypothetical protein
MSAVDWVKLELHLGNGRNDEPLRLPEPMSITTLAVLGDTSANQSYGLCCSTGTRWWASSILIARGTWSQAERGLLGVLDGFVTSRRNS